MKNLCVLLAVLCMLCLVVSARAEGPTDLQPSQVQGGIPVYAPEVHLKEVGRVYPAPLIVPSYWREYRYRPTHLGRALYGPYRVRYTPGPPLMYVPN